MTSPDRRNIKLDIDITSDTTGGIAVNKVLKDTETSADKAGDALGRMGVDAKALDAEIKKTKASIADLDAQLLAVGNDKVIRGQLRGQMSWLKQLEDIAKRMDDSSGSSVGVTIGSAVGTRAGAGVFSGITDAIQSIPGTARGVLIGSAIGIGAVMSPAIGAIISGAVVGVAGVGGIVGGIVAASKDARVTRAWEQFAQQQITPSQFGREAFVGPTIAAIEELRDALEDMDLGEAFAKVAPFVETLAEGVGNFGRNIMPGLTHALDRAGPVINELAEGFADTGTAVGDMLRDMSDSEGTVEGMRYTFMLLNGAIHVIGDTMAGLGTLFHNVAAAGAETTGAMEDIAKFVPFMMPFQKFWADTNDDLERLSTNFDDMAPAADKAFTAVDKVSRTMNPFAGYLMDAAKNAESLNTNLLDLFNTQMNLDDATLTWHQDLLELKESVKENGTSLDINTEAGQNNRRMLSDLVQDAMTTRDAMLANGRSTETANQHYKDQIAFLRDLAAKLGFTKTEIDKMVGQYQITFVVNWKQIGNKPKISQAVLSESFAASEVFKGFHDGGFVPGQKGAPHLAVVHGGEFVVSNQMQAQAGMGPMGGGTHITVSAAPGADQQLVGMLVKLLQFDISSGAGGNVQQRLGRSRAVMS